MRIAFEKLQDALQRVLRHPSYLALAIVISIAAFLFAVWLPNLGLIVEVFRTSSAPFSAKLWLAVNLLGGIRTNFSALSASYTVAVALLFGLNAAMFAYYLKRSTGLRGKTFIAGFGGAASGALGIGCAACGSFILSSVLSFAGASAALTILPLRGGEFGILSVLLLLWSLVVISRNITNPLVCKPS